ncbi:MAG: helix-turn-helix domain-containing protein [Blautia marasmi]
MSETSYSVSETAKLLDVQSHVLRFWEDELHLPINRNEMGHRYYTRYDIQVLLAIKELKKKGLALKEIGSLIPFLYKDEENKKKQPNSPSKNKQDQPSRKGIARSQKKQKSIPQKEQGNSEP